MNCRISWTGCEWFCHVTREAGISAALPSSIIKIPNIKSPWYQWVDKNRKILTGNQSDFPMKIIWDVPVIVFPHRNQSIEFHMTDSWIENNWLMYRYPISLVYYSYKVAFSDQQLDHGDPPGSPHTTVLRPPALPETLPPPMIQWPEIERFKDIKVSMIYIIIIIYIKSISIIIYNRNRNHY